MIIKTILNVNSVIPNVIEILTVDALSVIKQKETTYFSFIFCVNTTPSYVLFFIIMPFLTSFFHIPLRTGCNFDPNM
jgi:hypothetical protein